MQVKLIDVLAITSLMCTAYILHSIPDGRPPDAATSLLGRPIEAGSGPIDLYVDYLNGGLSLLIFVSGFPYRGRQGVHEYYWIFCALPIGLPATRFRAMISVDELTLLQLPS